MKRRSGKCALLALLAVLVARAAGQGLEDGLGGNFCDASQLADLDALLEAAANYTGGRGGGGKGGSGRRLLQLGSGDDGDVTDGVLLPAHQLSPEPAVNAAGMPPRLAAINGSCPSDSAADLEAAYHVAAAPEEYASFNTDQTPGAVNLLPAVRDQAECNTCVAMSVASAAEASLASLLHRNAADFSFPARYAYYCNPERVCLAKWQVGDAVAKVREQSACAPHAAVSPSWLTHHHTRAR